MGTAIILAMTKHMTNRLVHNIDVKNVKLIPFLTRWQCWKSIIEKITESVIEYRSRYN